MIKPTKAVPANVRKRIVAHIPVGRMGYIEGVVEFVSYLGSEKSGLITGANLSINGGQHMY